MCKRADGEKLLPYMLRYIQEQPRVVMAFVAMSCAIGVYLDMRTFVDKHMDTLGEMTAELKTINTRLEHLEREHEAARSTLNIQH
ncbi:MAG: hypothetical protein IJY53_07650 [Akkermansia sp.]|nr:hypothetical protein [Akkermansia sp.]